MWQLASTSVSPYWLIQNCSRLLHILFRTLKYTPHCHWSKHSFSNSRLRLTLNSPQPSSLPWFVTPSPFNCLSSLMCPHNGQPMGLEGSYKKCLTILEHCWHKLEITGLFFLLFIHMVPNFCNGKYFLWNTTSLLTRIHWFPNHKPFNLSSHRGTPKKCTF